MIDHDIVLRYLEVLLQWPPVVGFIVVVLLILFRKEFANVIDRVAGIHLPGGSRIDTPQRQLPPGREEGDRPDVPAEEVAVPENVHGAEAERLRQAIRAERASAYLWEYRYLNRFLVPTTQGLLEWLATSTGPIALTYFDALTQQWVPDANERNAMIAALVSHHLAVVRDGMIEITPKGREYREWRGPLPAPSQPTAPAVAGGP